jgi:Xaa-Pro aminopeptidase
MDSVYADRRRRVLEAMGQGTLVVFAAPTAIRNHDVEHEYRQDSDFYYLTGLDEQECVLVLRAGSERPFTLFVRSRDPKRETWDGERVGVDGATGQFGANTAFAIEELSKQLLELLKGQSRLFYAAGRNHENDATIFSALRTLRERARRGDTGPTSLIEPSTILHEMRLLKSQEEVSATSRAIEITKAGYLSLFERTQPGMGEFELEGLLRERFRALGAERCAFPSIVASGRNGRILHHRKNNRIMKAGELVVVDSGAEFDYLAADITRTFPVSGTFTDLQKKAYETVLDAQRLAMESVRPGATLDDIHWAAAKRLCTGLIELGLLEGSLDELLDSDGFKKYYMHRTSHWLGMDVHDVGAYFVEGKPRPLVPGMMLTVEPGLYFDDDPRIPEGLRDTGIRIEDDVLVTSSGYVNLSTGIPKQPREIEALMRRGG